MPLLWDARCAQRGGRGPFAIAACVTLMGSRHDGAAAHRRHDAAYQNVGDQRMAKKLVDIEGIGAACAAKRTHAGVRLPETLLNGADVRRATV